MEIKKPIQIEADEWWFKGCFIQKQIHPLIKPYHVFKDTEQQETIDTCFTFTEAKKLCNLNEVKDFKQGYKSFLQ
jgi:hypothetical protein